MSSEQTPLTVAAAPHVHFSKTTFVRTILNPDEVSALCGLQWTLIILHVPDAFGGPTRSNVVQMATHPSRQDKLLLKCVEELRKREFEELFGCGVGQFNKDRVISLDKDVLTDPL